LLATRAHPVSRVASRFTALNAQTLRPVSAFSSIQQRFYSDGLAQEGRRQDNYNPDLARTRQPTQAQNDTPTAQVYVGNLFFDVTPGQLRQHFASFGEIEKSRIVASPEGHSKGYVTFHNIAFHQELVTDHLTAMVLFCSRISRTPRRPEKL
jgi:hypothetical protein